MKIQLPNSTNVGPINIGIQGQPPKFTADFASGQTVYIFPWDTGFSPENPNISILLKEKTNYGKDGQTGDGSVFINDAYSKGYRTCNVLGWDGSYCWGVARDNYAVYLNFPAQGNLPAFNTSYFDISYTSC